MAAVRMADLPTTGTDVLVVGAGPTGLMAGLVLTRRGVPVVVVDQKEGPTRESRALAVQARTMEIYDQLGLADQVLADLGGVGIKGSPAEFAKLIAAETDKWSKVIKFAGIAPQ